ncbi:CDP-alcohol phosphatidyltransferase family protein [Aureliella helgolandensis]|uniref:Inner membrane protein YnjF n=1 Tax=Aureliella helgolandensis TaxID=2527968 RepID=A0A518GHN9_9BACT|nr:CDP-alcohol phosphatidyltransferase family protein [Aureliella helgolandensis]QDV28088.1 Inner membrane protein YnjF [Aureliella helgolandensis]
MRSDCYSSGERGWMLFGQQLRARWLAPLLLQLTQRRVTADGITLLAGVIGLCFVPLWLMHYRSAALVCLAIHTLLDGLDGPLARFQHAAGPRGSFTDTLTDQLVISAVTMAWMIGSPTPLNISMGALYIFVYALVVFMAMVRNALDIPYSWLLRPRFFVYTALALDCCLAGPATGYLTTWVMLLCNLVLALKAATGFLRLRSRLPDSHLSNATLRDWP